MKKLAFALILTLVMSAVLSACGGEKEKVDTSVTTAESETVALTDSSGDINTVSDTDDDTDADSESSSGITAEMAYEGVYNYCRSIYDWSIAEDNPEIMYVESGEETETEYQVIFRSYTGSFVYFYVDKSNGNTRLLEYVPMLGIEEEAGSINLYDYLDSENN